MTFHCCLLHIQAVGFGLTVALGFPVVAMMVGIVRWGGEYFYFYVWSFLFMISILMLTIYPTLIAPLFNKYTKLDKGERTHTYAHTHTDTHTHTELYNMYHRLSFPPQHCCSYLCLTVVLDSIMLIMLYHTIEY